MPYCTVDQARAWVGFNDSIDDGELAVALAAAELTINTYCGGQRFELDATATARTFPVTSTGVVDLGARGAVIGNTTGMLVATDVNDDGLYSTAWAASDWFTEPYDGIGPDGSTGWPITRVVSTGNLWFPTGTTRPGVKITARWGWAVTPAPVSLACRMLTVAWHHRRATIAGQGGFEGFFTSTLHDDTTIQDLLAPYRHGTAIVGIG